MGNKGSGIDRDRKDRGGELFECRGVSHFQTVDLQGIESEYIAVSPVGRPWATIASLEARNLEGDEVAVELARRHRHQGGSACTLWELADLWWDVVNQPMGECPRKVELGRKIGVGDADRETQGAF